MDVIDFHCHFAGRGIQVDASRGNPPAQKAFWDGVSGRLTQEEELLESMRTARVAGRVINTSLEFVLAPGDEGDLDTVRRINDAIANVARRHSGTLTQADRPTRLDSLFDQCGLGQADRRLIAHGNARRLLHA